MLYVTQIGTYILPLLVLPYLSRVLSTEKYGRIAYAQFFMFYFVTLTDYGFGLTIPRKIAIVSHDLAAVSRIFSNVMLARALLMALGFVLLTAILVATPKLRADWLLFLICYLGVLGNVLFPQWLFQGLQKMQHIVYRDLSAKVISVLATFLLVHSDRDFLLAAALPPAGVIFSGVVSLFTIRHVTGVRFCRPAWGEINAEMRSSAPVFLSLAATTTYTSTNTFLLGLVSTPAMVAFYTNAYRVIAAFRGLVSPVVTAIYPYISRIASGSSRDGMLFLQRYGLLISVPFLAASLALFFGSTLGVRILFGDRYSYTASLLRVMSLIPFLHALGHCFCTYFMLAFGHQKEWTRLIWKTVAVNFAVLIPLMYWIEPAMALAITGVALDLFIAVYSYLFYRRHAAHALSNAGPAQPAAVSAPRAV